MYGWRVSATQSVHCRPVDQWTRDGPGVVPFPGRVRPRSHVSPESHTTVGKDPSILSDIVLLTLDSGDMKTFPLRINYPLLPVDFSLFVTNKVHM